MLGASPCPTTTSYSLRSEPVVSSQRGSLWASSTATWSAASVMPAQDKAVMTCVRVRGLVWVSLVSPKADAKIN